MAIMLTDVAGLVTFLISLCSVVTTNNAKPIPFSANLIHHHSPLSPFYNPNMTWHERWIDVIKRSYNRAALLSNITSISPNDLLYSNVSPAVNNEYLMSVRIGTARREMLVIPDTASNFIWVQCEPCDPNQCTHLRYPRYDPRDSETYRPVSPNDPICQNLLYRIEDDTRCMYEILYADGCYSSGITAIENMFFSSIDQPILYERQNVVFGCSYANGGVCSEYLGGVFGIGPGAYSFIGQAAEDFDNTFSYCLPSADASEGGLGKIVFGIQYIDIDEVSTTRLYVENDGQAKFYINLLAISINDVRYDYPAPGYQQGNMMIDSGSPLTLLPPDYYYLITNALDPFILAAGAERVPSPRLYEWAFCYDSLEDLNLPTVTMHFEGGSLNLQPGNLYFNPSYRLVDRVHCIAFAPFIYDQVVPIYGAIGHSNFWVEYNLDDMLLSFVPADCSHAQIT